MSRKNISDLQVVEAYIEAIKSGVWPYEVLQKITGEPEKVCYAAMERACDRGFIDYGVSLRAGFPTNEGLKILEGKDKK